MARLPLKDKDTNVGYPALGLEESTYDGKGKQPIKNLGGNSRKENGQDKDTETPNASTHRISTTSNGKGAPPSHGNSNSVQQSGSHHVVDTSIKEWQRHWREIMTRSIFYFHELDNQTKSRVAPTLSSLGATIQPFFDREVTIVISNGKAPSMENNSTDVLAIAKRHEMKIWSMDKLIRFLGNLGHVPSKLTVAAPKQELSHLLKEEKLLGHHSDRDPNAKREDYYYFKGPYVLVWDPLHTHRPTLCREYTRTGPTDDDGDWPRMKLTEPGRCVFVVTDKETLKKQSQYKLAQQQLQQALQTQDPIVTPAHDSATNSIKELAAQVALIDKKPPESVVDVNKACEKVSGDSTAVESRDVVTKNADSLGHANKKIILQGVNGAATPTARSGLNNASPASTVVDTPLRLPTFDLREPAPQPASAQGSGYKFYDIAASGVSRSNTYTIASIAMSGDLGKHNGLAAPTAQVPSREIANLKRKVLSRPYQMQTLNNFSDASTPQRSTNSPTRRQITYADLATPQQHKYNAQAQKQDDRRELEAPKAHKYDEKLARSAVPSPLVDKDSRPNEEPANVAANVQECGVSSLTSEILREYADKKNLIEEKEREIGKEKVLEKEREKEFKPKEARLLRTRKVPEFEKSRDNRGGYCENCRETFDRFAVHIQSAKHRSFACDPRNFTKLDDFLERLKRG